MLFKPDLAIHIGSQVVVVDVAVNWEGNVPLDRSNNNKRLIYDNASFREAAERRWPGKFIVIETLILGSRGI